VTAHSENARQWVHAGSGLFALLLRVTTWPQAAALAAVALVFNLVMLPRIGGRRLYRPVDTARGFPLGILLYPFSVLLLTLIFRSRLDIVAAAWAIMAFGDGAATLVGRATTRNAKPAKPAKQDRAQESARAIGRAATLNAKAAKPAKKDLSLGFAGFAFYRPLPWNHDKTVAGTVAFVVCGGLAGVALAWWTRPAVASAPSMIFTIAAPLVAAAVAALVETLPVRLDDNISVPATAGAVLWLASLMTAASIGNARAMMAASLPWAVGLNALTAGLGYRAKTVSQSGAIAGAIVGTVIYVGGGAGAWILLLAAFLAASVTSRLGLKRKVLLGIAEERGGRRGAGNAIANCGVAAAAAIAAVATPYRASSLLALVAALTAGGSDTVASEIGKAWGRSTFLVTTLSRVPPGTPGAMSLEGTAAGLAAAFALAAVGFALGLIPAPALLAVVVGATFGALVESALGATLEGPGILNNDMLNALNTAVAAAVALVLA
jgi:uncharacterized protein (TIGR00297 family)